MVTENISGVWAIVHRNKHGRIVYNDELTYESEELAKADFETIFDDLEEGSFITLLSCVLVESEPKPEPKLIDEFKNGERIPLFLVYKENGHIKTETTQDTQIFELLGFLKCFTTGLEEDLTDSIDVRDFDDSESVFL